MTDHLRGSGWRELSLWQYQKPASYGTRPWLALLRNLDLAQQGSVPGRLQQQPGSTFNNALGVARAVRIKPSPPPSSRPGSSYLAERSRISRVSTNAYRLPARHERSQFDLLPVTIGMLSWMPTSLRFAPR